MTYILLSDLYYSRASLKSSKVGSGNLIFEDLKLPQTETVLGESHYVQSFWGTGAGATTITPIDGSEGGGRRILVFHQAPLKFEMSRSTKGNMWKVLQGE